MAGDAPYSSVMMSYTEYMLVDVNVQLSHVRWLTDRSVGPATCREAPTTMHRHARGQSVTTSYIHTWRKHDMACREKQRESGITTTSRFNSMLSSQANTTNEEWKN